MRQLVKCGRCAVLAVLLGCGPAWAGGGHHGGAWGGGGHYGGWGGGHYGHFGGWGRGYYGGYYGGGVGIGVYGLGPGFGWSYYPPYYAYPPAVVTVPAEPPVYIEQGGTPPAANYWHYCRNPDGYYPYVKECPGGWQLVPPQPPQH